MGEYAYAEMAGTWEWENRAVAWISQYFQTKYWHENWRPSRRYMLRCILRRERSA